METITLTLPESEAAHLQTLASEMNLSVAEAIRLQVVSQKHLEELAQEVHAASTGAPPSEANETLAPDASSPEEAPAPTDGLFGRLRTLYRKVGTISFSASDVPAQRRTGAIKARIQHVRAERSRRKTTHEMSPKVPTRTRQLLMDALRRFDEVHPQPLPNSLWPTSS